MDPDPSKIESARQLLTRHGVYGSRVMLLQGDLDQTNLPDYFANLVIAETSTAEAKRVQRPWGGTLITGSKRREEGRNPGSSGRAPGNGLTSMPIPPTRSIRATN